MVGTAPNPGDCTAYWPLEDTSDTSGNGNTLTVSGATSGATGIISDGYSFDGVNDIIETGIGSGDGFGTQDFSVCIWVKTTATVSDTFISCQEQGPPYDGWFLGVGETGNEGKIRVTVNGNTNNLTFYGTVAINDGNWHHIGFTHDYSTGENILYVDGAVSATNTTNTGDFSTSQTMELGGRNGSPFFDGDLDEACLFIGTILTADNMTYLYQAGSPGAAQQYPFTAGSNVDGIKLGGTTINKVYLGSTEINKMYLGSTVIYEK